MRTSYLSQAKKTLAKALDSTTELTAEEWREVAEDVMQNISNTLLFARNATSKGFLSTTNMSEEQIRETDAFKRIAALKPGEGCTLTITPDVYRFVRWVVKRDNPAVRFRTIKLSPEILSVSRVG